MAETAYPEFWALLDGISCPEQPCFAETHDKPVKAEYAAYYSCACKRLYCTYHMDDSIRLKHVYAGTTKMQCPGWGRHSLTPVTLDNWEKL